ncbi:uncharacterized protein LOC127792979 isoform X2 [Diospyros lotus]|nr:uncharacterized protein LOC127792979 isoform X2 [Diospyros lotus]
MSSSNRLSAEVGNFSHQNAFPVEANLSHCSESHLDQEDEEEDEEQDVDFNPFLKESPSLEASSGLSSEIEVLDADITEGEGNTDVALPADFSSIPAGLLQDYALGGSEQTEQIVRQTKILSGETGEKEFEKATPSRLRKRNAVLISQLENENETSDNKGICSISGLGAINDVMDRDITNSGKPIMDIDDDDAIFKRTRARYSLASFTLDELETFLQETDDDEDLQNVDDEEEYRKFLAAVLQGGDGDNQSREGNGNVDDEDEENDADFELEIEEALESDLDENTRGDNQEEREAAGRRPETRLNRRQKASTQQKHKLLEQSNRPLRPLLPNAPVVSFPMLIPETASHSWSFSGHDGSMNGFTPHQLGQLHCLIHEHVQLLIQVFSLCVLDPSRQHIACQVQKLISEILHKRDQEISRRSVPYPCFFFCPPYINPSLQCGYSKSLTAPSTSEPACSVDEHRNCSSGTISPSRGSRGHDSTGKGSPSQTFDSAFWVPSLNGQILSVLDVAPLSLLGKYMEDVSIAVQEHQKQCIQATCDDRFKKEPLYPLHCFQTFLEADMEVLRGTTSPAAKAPSYPVNDQPPKKTLAASLVERTKKQPVALVPKEIADLAQRFLPLFNSALFPHKPPPGPVANRVLFTDAEDELLALGLMEYNTDWKAIQQRFLPCKSKHQIFVRQKNRSSSKAPENPIKAVRRMKSSPLTAEEVARIQEGLKIFKLDWMSIWKFIVPYRDPSLLPRQWRIATGTQKSYKLTADKKEKRRIYESNRRKCKPAALASWQTSSEKEGCQTDNAGGENNSGDDCVDNEDEAYVHEAFLADWRPGASFPLSSGLPVSNLNERNRPSVLVPLGGCHTMELTNSRGSGESHPQIGDEFPAAFKDYQNLETFSHFTPARCYSYPVQPNQPVSHVILRPSKSQVCSRPYRSRRTNTAHLVKLAPDLPPVNLPPSVRVMSQSAFKSYQGGVPSKVPAADASSGAAAAEKIVSSVPHNANLGSTHPAKYTEYKRPPPEKTNINEHQQEPSVLGDKFAGDKGESDLQMHPLLFQPSGDGHLPYYSFKSSSTQRSSNFFSQIQPQLNLTLLYNPHEANNVVNRFDKSLKSKKTTSCAGSIDFHPLLQIADDINIHSETVNSVAQVSVTLEPLGGGCAQLQTPFDATQSKSQVNCSTVATSTKSSSPNEKANELDLDIHLSFISRKEKAIGGRDAAEHNQTTTENSCYQNSGFCPGASIPIGVSKKLNSAAQALVASNNNSSTYGVNDGGDQPPLEIVMEHEELSDSEEEIGEQVEFECEEMDDSEGDEGSDSEHMIDVQNE